MHTDVWGPASTSLSKMQYNIIFVDDCTRHWLCKQMKSKHKTSNKLQQYLVLIQHQYGYTPKMIWIDQGREYITRKFCTWCTDQGIIIETTAPYSPSENGVAERMNQTLTELAQVMIIAHNILKSLWLEVINHGGYIHNWLYTWAIKGNTPKGAWSNLCPNVAHLQEFRIPVWIFQEKQHPKLEPKSVKQIFVGFEDDPKAIKYYDTATHCVKTSQNYIFNSTNPPVQFEGEEEMEEEQIGIEPVSKKRKHPIDENPDVSPKRSTRPRVLY